MDVTTRRGRTGRFHGRWWGGLGRGVVLGAALLVASCGGGDEGGDAGGTTAPSDGAAAEVDDGAAISTETGTAVPAWWPSQVALPDGLDIGAAAETTSGGGVLDLAGNVWEFTVDDWSSAGAGHTIRGGSYLNTLMESRASVRWASGRESEGAEYLGFRCVIDVDRGARPTRRSR